MRKTVLFAALLACALFTSCTDKKAEFIKQLSEAMSGDSAKAALTSIYPDAKDMELNLVAFNPDTVTVTENEKEMLLKVGDVTFNIAADEKGEFQVKSTKGLLKVAPELMAFAKQTGWYKPELTDKENSVALQDTIFPKLVKEAFIKEVTSKVKVDVVGSAYNYSAMTCHQKAVVTNKSKSPIKGNMYAICLDEYGWSIEAMRDVLANRKVVGGMDVEAGGSASLDLGTFDAEYTSFGAKIKWSKDIDVVALGFKGKGNEYDEYKSGKKK